MSTNIKTVTDICKPTTNSSSSGQYPTINQKEKSSIVNLAKPQPEDLQQTKKLLKALVPHSVFESHDEIQKRVSVLSKLNTLTKMWIEAIGKANKMSEETVQKLGGKIYTFGSYRLGVQESGADIDALCVVPSLIKRSDFFTTFFELLQRQPEVTECLVFEDSVVPFIRMVFDDIDIDLLFARLALEQIPDDLDLRDDNLLNNLDPRCVRSLDGCRVADEILAGVKNLDSFRLALRTIKLWAKKRGIYSSSLGYFGGVTWSMMVARICQLYPNAAAATIVHNFFLFYSLWNWPSPIVLKRRGKVANLELSVWKPNSDRLHLMPIITPAYPQRNSTCRVSESTKKIILGELQCGVAICNDILLERASWESLFKVPSFFHKYRHFFKLSLNSEKEAHHLEWCEIIGQKLHLLVSNLDRSPQISTVHVNAERFEFEQDKVKPTPKSSNCSADEEDFVSESPFHSMWFIGFEFYCKDGVHVDLIEGLMSFLDTLAQYGANHGLSNESTLEMRYLKRKQLKHYLDEDLLKRDRKSMKKLAVVFPEAASTLLLTPPKDKFKFARGAGQK